MREKPKSLSKVFCWVVAPLMWGAPALIHGLDLRAGIITSEQYWSRHGLMALILPLVIAMPFIEAWRARRPKSPPVYRSTILD